MKIAAVGLLGFWMTLSGKSVCSGERVVVAEDNSEELAGTSTLCMLQRDTDSKIKSESFEEQEGERDNVQHGEQFGGNGFHNMQNKMTKPTEKITVLGLMEDEKMQEHSKEAKEKIAGPTKTESNDEHVEKLWRRNLTAEGMPADPRSTNNMPMDPNADDTMLADLGVNNAMQIPSLSDEAAVNAMQIPSLPDKAAMPIDPNANNAMQMISSLSDKAAWSRVGGTLSMVSVDGDGHVIGVNSGGGIYAASGGYATSGHWIQIPGSLMHVDVNYGEPASTRRRRRGSVQRDMHVWGVSADHKVWYSSALSQNAQLNSPDGGRLKQISVAPNGHVWGVNGADHIFFRSSVSSYWQQVGGSLSYVSVDGDKGQFVWGVNGGGDIYFRDGFHGHWQHIGGKLKQLDVNSRGVVWGVNSADQIFRRDGVSGHWLQQPGYLKHVSVGRSHRSDNVWGVNGAGEIYHWTYR